MNKELYFLRSSEQKIVTNMFEYAHPTSSDKLLKYTEYYGLTTKDLGLYALVDNKIAGAIWSRVLNPNEIPTLSVAIVPEFKGQGIGSFMMTQFLQEAGTIYDELYIDISAKPKSLKFYEKFGFCKDAESFKLFKKLERKEIVRPTDGYDASYWIE